MSTALDDPASDLNFREPLVDALRRQKDEVRVYIYFTYYTHIG